MTHRRFLTGAIPLGLIFVGLAVLQARPTEAARAAPVSQHAVIEIDIGDVVRVSGAGIGCMVRQRDGVKVLDCRRAGEAAGTYGTTFDERRVRVVRFKSSTLAKTVFFARHRHSRTKTCS